MRCISALVIFIVLGLTLGQESSRLIGSLRKGLEMAGKFFGFKQTDNLAKLVSDTFGNKYKQKGDGKENVFSGFLRLLGLNASKISAMAVNAVIFIAQLISSTLSKPPPPQITEARKLKEGTPLDWLMNSSKITDLMERAKSSSLSEEIIEYIQERSLDEDTGCIQQLICKTSPFIRGMQKALVPQTKGPKLSGPKVLYAFLPRLQEVIEHGETCEKNFSYCTLH